MPTRTSNAVRIAANRSAQHEEDRREALRLHEASRFESPTIDDVSLSCEISAYAPDGDDFPLF